MKNTINIGLVLVICLLIFGCAKKEESKSNTPKDVAKKEISIENKKTSSFEIDGMTCAVGCAATIEKKLVKLDGVGEAKVDFETKTATIVYDKTKESQESLINTIENVAGGGLYKVSKIIN